MTPDHDHDHPADTPATTDAPASRRRGPGGKRQAEDTEALVYAYGVREPENPDTLRLIWEEQRRQMDMWDALVLADRAAETAVENAARADPDIGPLLAEIDRINAAIGEQVTERRALRAASRARVDTPEQDAAIETLASERRAARKALWPLLSAWRKANRDTLTAIETTRREQSKAIRQNSGLYWGNYNRVLDDFERGRKLARKTGGRMRLSDRYRRDGVLTVQIQSCQKELGASMQQLMEGRFNPLRIWPVPADIADRRVHGAGGQARKMRTRLAMRLDAAGNTLEAKVYIHRLPPPGSRIKRAQLTWRQVGGHMRWGLVLTVSTPVVTRPAHPSRAAVGVDLGWRLQPDGALLVATAWDGAKATRYTLDARWMREMDKVERLQGHIDENLLALAGWYFERPAEFDALPDDLREPLMGWRPRRGASRINSPALLLAVQGRIAAVADRVDRAAWRAHVRTLPPIDRRDAWRHLPPEAQADVPARMREWYQRHRHLSDYHDGLRERLVGRRKDLYRRIARELAMTYAVIGVEDLDLAELARTKKRAAEDGDNPLHAAARANRVRANLTLFRLELAHQAKKHNAGLVLIDGPSTCRCDACGGVTGQKSRDNRVWTCEHCGAVWDQDINAARNLHTVATGGDAGPVQLVSAPAARKAA